MRVFLDFVANLFAEIEERRGASHLYAPPRWSLSRHGRASAIAGARADATIGKWKTGT